MTIFTDLTNIDFEKLESFVYNHPNGNFFQSTKAYQFFKSVENYEPILIVAKNGEEIVGSLLAVLIKEKGIKGYFSRRCIVWGGPLVKEDGEAIFQNLVNKLVDFSDRRSIYTEFRNLFDLSGLKKFYYSCGYSFRNHLNYVVDITTEEEAWRKLSSSKRRQIRLSLKNGAEIIEAESVEQIKGFYLILKKMYQEKVKKPLPNFDFFKKFYLTPQLGKYLLIKYQDDIIGGMLCPVYKDTIYEWYICGFDGKYNNIYPSVLATWAPIEYAARNGLKYFDFMGAGKPDEDYGVREFKSKFGGKEVCYGRFLRINNHFLYHLGKLGLKVMKVLK